MICCIHLLDKIQFFFMNVDLCYFFLCISRTRVFIHVFFEKKMTFYTHSFSKRVCFCFFWKGTICVGCIFLLKKDKKFTCFLHRSWIWTYDYAEKDFGERKVLFCNFIQLFLNQPFRYYKCFFKFCQGFFKNFKSSFKAKAKVLA
jgi:hypothetical protein